MLLPLASGLIQNPVRLVRGQPLIPQVDRQSSQLAQLGGKGLRPRRLRARLAGKMHWIPHYNSHHAKSPAKPRQRPQILARVTPSLKRHHRLSRQPQLVRHSHPDAAIADIETEIARMARGFQIYTLAASL